MKIKEFKNGAYTVFERMPISGMYFVTCKSPTGQTIDRIQCDSYRTACEYLRAFNKLAKGA